jgi:hypothetical protein
MALKRCLSCLQVAQPPLAASSLRVEILHALGGKHACKFDSEACKHELLTRVRVAKNCKYNRLSGRHDVLCMHLYVINMHVQLEELAKGVRMVLNS